MKKRTITAAVLLAIFLPCLFVNELFWLFQGMMMLCVVLASIEMIRMYEQEKKFPLGAKVTIVISSLLVYLSALSEYSFLIKLTRNNVTNNDLELLFVEGLNLMDITIHFLPAYMIVCLVFFAFSVFYEEFDGSYIGKSLTVVTYVGIGFAALTILRYVGLRVVVYLLLTTIFTDVFAYFFGMAFGKHKMCPRISPKKSWEGAIAGTILGSAIAICFAFFYGSLMKNIDPEAALYPTILYKIMPKETVDLIPMWAQFLIITGATIILSIAGQIGDLVASRLKRTYSIKDFGRIFPGHGGVLDRLDSAIFAAILLLCVVMFVVSVI